MSQLSVQDVELFRRIPRRTHKVKLFQTYPESFTGKEAFTFLKTTFDYSDAEAEKWGSLLIQANVIKPLNFRLTNSFQNKQKNIYELGPEEEQNLFWLDIDDSESESENPSILDIITSDVDGADMSKLEGLEEIPEIPALPFIGNAFDVAGPLDTNRSMCILGRELCQKYGGIFRLSLMGHSFIVVSDPNIVQQVFESPDFGKKTETDAIFKELRRFRGEGLTTVSDGPLHDQCQSLLSPKLVKSCFVRYVPIIANTMNTCFREEFGKAKNDVDFRKFWKKCTLRSVGKIAMGIDLYEGNKWKSFCDNLTYVADEAINRVFKGTSIIPLFNYKFKNAIRSMNKKILKVITDRREQHEIHGKDPETFDLLDIMITSPISESASGKSVSMNDELIRANLITILSAGHSTTTSMLSWTCNFLYDSSLGNNDYRYALIQEIASVSKGDRRYIPNVNDVYKNLNLLTCILKESLRLCPPIPTIVRHCFQSTNLCGYKVKKNETIMISCLGTHLNPASWDDPYVYNPYRFSEPVPHPCAFIPWAGGPRQCIGREFALLTGRIGMFLLLNQFSLEMSPNARVREDEHLFVFPEGLLMNAVIRKDMKNSNSPSPQTPDLHSSKEKSVDKPQENQAARAWEGLKALIRESGHQVTILSGTKTGAGNSNTIAQLLLDKALSFNFKTGESPMDPDEYLPQLKSSPDSFTIVALCVSTYQGNPAPNAKQTFEWLRSLVSRLENGEQELATLLSNVHYFVFGCGNMNWATTYNKVAKFFDENLQKLGAKQICPPGFYDESQDDLEEEFAEFYKIMAPRLMHSLPEIGDKRLRAVDASSIVSKPAVVAHAASSAFQMDIIGDADDIGAPDLIPSTVDKQIFNCPIRLMQNITPDADRATLHIEFELQAGMNYRAGDHLAICPVMPNDLVERVLGLFVDYDGSTIIRWTPQMRQSRMARFQLPMSVPMTIDNVFRNLLDLKAIPTKQFLVNLSTITADPSHATELQRIAGDTKIYKEWLKENLPVSNADIISQFPPKGSELRRLIEILPVIKPRPYSICSSPKIDSSSVQICVGVVEDSYKEKNLVYRGVSSYYLKSLLGDFAGSSCNVFVERADESFDVPKDNSKPMIMISAGTGFAPMRSFLQERKARQATGEIYVFFGCRNEEQDWLYSDELKKYREDGLLTGLFVGFSRSQVHPPEYVQAKILEQADLVWDALDNKGAFIYVCGSGTRVGVGTRDSLLKIISEKSQKSAEFAEEYIADLEANGRYEQDVWG